MTITNETKSKLFQDLVKFRCGVYGIEEYNTFYDDENIDDFIQSHERLCLESKGLKEEVWDEYIEWINTEFVGVKVNLSNGYTCPTCSSVIPNYKFSSVSGIKKENG